MFDCKAVLLNCTKIPIVNSFQLLPFAKTSFKFGYLFFGSILTLWLFQTVVHRFCKHLALPQNDSSYIFLKNIYQTHRKFRFALNSSRGRSINSVLSTDCIVYVVIYTQKYKRAKINKNIIFFKCFFLFSQFS